MALQTFVLCFVILFAFFQVSSSQNCPEPDHCTCEGNTVRCIGLEGSGKMRVVLRGLVADLPSTEDLSFVDTGISTISATSFENLGGLKKLRFINSDFSGTGVSALAFEGLTQLEELTISGNDRVPPIEFPFKVFTKMPVLKKLDLSRNNLLASTINQNVLQGLAGLETLNLSNNAFGNLEGSQFQSLTSLKSLYLRSSKVRAVTLTTFDGLTGLEELDLSGNPSIVLSDDALTPLIRLANLYLSSNDLEKVRPEIFKPVKGTLKVLDLSANKFDVIQNKEFQELSNLKVLNLSAMVVPVKRIQSQAFLGLTNLETLDLRSNQMTHIPVDPYKIIPETRVDLDDNLFFCNCEVAGMHQWLTTQKHDIVVTCTMPLRFRGKSVATLDMVGEVGCKEPTLLMKDKVRGEIGNTAQFECGVTDYHSHPEVNYKVISGSPLPLNRTTIKIVNTTSPNIRKVYTFKYVFTVLSVRNSDSGKIECSGSGSFGSVTATIDIFYGQEGLPLWVIIVIIASVIVVFAVVIIVVIVLRKKKKKSEKYSSVPRVSITA